MNMSTADRHANNRQDPLRQTGAQGLRAAHSSRLLSPRMLDSLKNLELVARAMVEGSLTGLHRSPYHGFSSEFSEYRKYCPGDAVKHVDWVAYAKTDRYYVKQYEDETNTRAYIVLDRSGSMALGAAKNHKFNYACYLAAAFLYLMQRQKDAVGLFTYTDRIESYYPAKTSRMHMLSLLAQAGNSPIHKYVPRTVYQKRLPKTTPRMKVWRIFFGSFNGQATRPTSTPFP